MNEEGTVFELGANRYGKSRIRLVTVTREPDRHHLRDLTVDIALEGDFSAAHVDGDNANVIATDTMKNTVYAFARDRLTGAPEAFGLQLARHFAAYPQVDRATVTLREHGWARIPLVAGPAPDAFTRLGDLTRVAVIAASVAGATVEAGIEDLTVMKTTKSAFTGFDRDRYTTLPEVDDRLMATKITAVWRYGETAAEPGFDFDAAFERARGTLLTVLAEHFSPSVQTSIWIMGTAMLEAEPAMDWVRMVLPNLHHWTVDLEPFGLDNPGMVFVSTTEPHGLIDATVRRGG
ncbi:MAG TPA: urate oxidase [Candidatus Sulfomarinibacteraceae bacterium]|nr:urate oxidase [Candidatus Sulfomarinibacteraceae bacterium]